MINTDKILEEFDKKFEDWNFHHKDLGCFHDSVTEHLIKVFFIESIAQALVEDRARVRGVIEKLQNDGLEVIIEGDYYVNFRDVENILSSLDKPKDI